MTEKKIELIKRICGIALSVLIVLTGICFITVCLKIYGSGSSPFTVESISRGFSSIAAVVWICVAAILLRGAFGLIFPDSEKKLRADKDDERTLRGLMARYTVKEGTDAAGEVNALRKKRGLIKLVTSIICVICALLPLPWALNTDRYTLEALTGNRVIIETVILVAAFTAVALAACAVAVVLMGRSRSRELAVIKAALASGDAVKLDPSVNQTEAAENAEARETAAEKGRASVLRAPKAVINWCSEHVGAVRIAVLAVGVVFLVLGTLNGGMGDVLHKAIKICTECIGLG
ncbi:MAG: hypothetical protein IJY04_08820 [Clostridia bacterium]|nr:hypothetical protein [Clostridia bacterium]